MGSARPTASCCGRSHSRRRAWMVQLHHADRRWANGVLRAGRHRHDGDQGREERTTDSPPSSFGQKDKSAGKYNTPVLKDGLLYGLAPAGRGATNFFCMKADTGDVLWTDAAKRGECGAVLDAGGVLLALTSDSQLVAFKPSDKEYAEVAKYKVADSRNLGLPDHLRQPGDREGQGFIDAVDDGIGSAGRGRVRRGPDRVRRLPIPAGTEAVLGAGRLRAVSRRRRAEGTIRPRRLLERFARHFLPAPLLIVRQHRQKLFGGRRESRLDIFPGRPRVRSRKERIRLDGPEAFLLLGGQLQVAATSASWKADSPGLSCNAICLSGPCCRGGQELVQGVLLVTGLVQRRLLPLVRAELKEGGKPSFRLRSRVRYRSFSWVCCSAVRPMPYFSSPARVVPVQQVQPAPPCSRARSDRIFFDVVPAEASSAWALGSSLCCSIKPLIVVERRQEHPLPQIVRERPAGQLLLADLDHFVGRLAGELQPFSACSARFRSWCRSRSFRPRIGGRA